MNRCPRFRCAVKLAASLLSSVSVAVTAAPQCLADISSAASGDYGYRIRGDRCEGELKNFVGLTDGVYLVGYHDGPVTIDLQGASPLKLKVVGDSAGAVYLRALSVTSIARYQMDEELFPLTQHVEWPIDVLRAITHTSHDVIDVSTIGVIACSHQCKDGPETTYWPVRSLTADTADHDLVIMVRSANRAVNVKAWLQAKNGTSIALDRIGALDSDMITAIRLPAQVGAGTYRLFVTAKEFPSHRPLAPFSAMIAIPREKQ